MGLDEISIQLMKENPELEFEEAQAKANEYLDHKETMRTGHKGTGGRIAAQALETMFGEKAGSSIGKLFSNKKGRFIVD